MCSQQQSDLETELKEAKARLLDIANGARMMIASNLFKGATLCYIQEVKRVAEAPLL